MFRWRKEIINSKDLVLVNRDNLDMEKLTALFEKIEISWKNNREEISAPMFIGMSEFYNACIDRKGEIVLKYKVYSKMLRWIITEGNPKYDAVRFYGWRDALKNLWKYLFDEHFHEFHEYLGGRRYKDDDSIWREWYKCIGGE